MIQLDLSLMARVDIWRQFEAGWYWRDFSSEAHLARSGLQQPEGLLANGPTREMVIHWEELYACGHVHSFCRMFLELYKQMF
jgi:hypothetical protein